MKPRYKQHAYKQNSVTSKRFQSPDKRYRNFYVMLLGYEQHGYRETSLTSNEKSSPRGNLPRIKAIFAQPSGFSNRYSTAVPYFTWCGFCLKGGLKKSQSVYLNPCILLTYFANSKRQKSVAVYQYGDISDVRILIENIAFLKAIHISMPHF